MITDVTNTSNAYWALVYGRAFVDVEKAAVAVDQQLYEDNQKQLAIGTMAPLDVVTAESQLASDQQALVQAQGAELQDETQLLNDITKNPGDPVLQNVEVVPTTPISTADSVGNPAIEDAVQSAWQARPELQEIALQLKNDNIEAKVTTNALLPTLNLVGQYSTTGLGGIGKETTVTQGALEPNPLEPIFINGVQEPEHSWASFHSTSAVTIRRCRAESGRMG